MVIVSLLASPAFAGRAAGMPQAAQMNYPIVPDRITGPIDETKIVPTNSRNVHPYATPQNDLGRVSDSLPMEKMILLLMRSPEQKAALDAMVDQLHNPHSPMYHKWLTPDEIGHVYGPSDNDIATITAWLQAHGFTIDEVPAGRTHIIISGTAGQVRQAFHTEIHNYMVNGEMHVANDREPQIPAALVQVVQGFRSLHNFLPKPAIHNSHIVKKDPNTGKWYPKTKGGIPHAVDIPNTVDITYGSGTTEEWLVGPQDWYTIYGENSLLTSGITGSGQTIAVIEETNINFTDVTTFRSQFNLPTYPATANNTQGGINQLLGANGSCTNPGILNDGEEPEADLDVQWAGVAAPAATIDFVSCATTSSTAGIDLSATYVVNHLSSTVSSMSLSYGVCETELTGSGSLAIYQADSYYNKLWEQAAAQGQTVVVSSGDSGSEGCDQNVDVGKTASTETHGLQVSGMESTPYNVSAGGTDFSDTFNGTNSTYWNSNDTQPFGSALSYVPETPWGSYCANPLFLEYAILHDGFASTETIPAFCTTLRAENAEYTDVVGGSGGYSDCATGTPTTAGLVGGSCAGYAKPSWQSMYGVPADGVRDVPDLSFFASSGWWSHALVYCDSATDPCTYTSSTDGEALSAGGTSFVAPQINGIMALVAQKTGSWQGQANYTLYAMAANEFGAAGSSGNSGNLSSCNANNGNTIGSSCVFYDIGPTTNVSAGGTVAAANSQPCNTVSGTTTQTPCYKGSSTYGVSSTSATTENNAWASTAGYDYATGIGSANVTNLVNNWNSYGASFATTTTISANPTTIAPSGSTTLTATVATTGRGGISAASGTVSFYIGSTSGTFLGSGNLTSSCTGTAPNVVCSAKATLSVQGSALNSGNNSLIAYFPGDGANDAASTSNSVTVTVQVATTTAVMSSLNPSSYGQSVNFTATVTGNSPTGTVQFVVDGSNFGSPVALSGGSATSGNTSTLAAGNHTVTANYSGDSLNLPSTGSLSGGQTVTDATSSTTVTSGTNPSAYGQSVTFTANIVGQNGAIKGKKSQVKSNAITGTVTWTLNTSCGTTPVTTNPDGSGTATCTTSSIPVGSNQTVTGTYSGDANHSGSQGSVSQTVNQGSTSISVTSVNPGSEGYGQDAATTITAVLSWTGGGTAPSAANVTIGGNGQNAGGYSATSCGSASGNTITCTATYTPSTADVSGNYTETAAFSGDASYTGSTSSQTNNFTIGDATSSTAVTSSPNPSSYGQSVTFTAAITGQYGAVKGKVIKVKKNAITGTVTWSGNTGCGTTPVITNADGSGTATCSTSILAAGSDTVTGTYSGDANHSGSQGSASQTVNGGSATTINVTSVNPSSEAYGQDAAATITAVLSWTGGGVAPTAANVLIGGNGPSGYSGTTCGSPSGDTMTCTATYTPTTADVAGSYTENATFSGDTNYGSSSSPQTNNFTIGDATSSTTVASGTNPSTYGQAVTFTATIEGEYGAIKGKNARVKKNAITGTVTWSAFTGCGTTPVTTNADGSGTATCTTATLRVGNTDHVTANYSGDANHSGSQGTYTGQVVNQAATTISVTSVSPASEDYGSTAPVAVTAVLSWSGSGTAPTAGDVSIGGSGLSGTFGATTCGSPSGDTTTCSATYTPSGTDAAGAYTMTAAFSGDTNYTGSNSSQTNNFTVNDATSSTTVASGTNPSSYGQSVTFTATIIGENGSIKGRKVIRVKKNAITGSVTWTSNTGCGTTPVTTNADGSGTATCTTSTLDVGSDTVTGTYSGDSNHSGSQGSVSQQVNGGVGTTINVTSVSPSSEAYGQDAAATITALLSWTGNAAAPTAANVTISGNGNGSYSGTSCGSPSGDTMTCTAMYTPTTADQAGAYTEVATFSGDNHYSGSSSPQTNNFTIGDATSSTTVTSGTNPSTYGGSVTFTATITGQYSSVKGKNSRVKQNAITGTVTWTSNTGCGTTPVTTNADGSGTATCTTSSLGGGSDTVSGTYSGDSNHTGSSGSVSQTVNPASQTITFTTNPPTSEPYNGQFTVAATASSGLTVTFTSAGSCSNSGATYTMTSGTGTCSVIANQAGNANYSAAQPVTKSVTAKPASQTITFTTDPPANAVYNTQFTVAATASSGLTVAFTSASACSNSGATYTMTSGTGTCFVTANQSGNADYSAATPLEKGVAAVKANPTVTFTGLPASLPYGNTYTLSTTTNASTTPTIGDSTPAVCSLSGSTVTIVATTGTCTVEAFWPADNNYNSASAQQSGTAAIGVPVITWATPNPINYGVKLSSTQLDAHANVVGRFVYSPVAGTVLNAGYTTLTATFTPTSTKYSKATDQVTLQVLQDTTTTSVTSSDQTITLKDGTAGATVDFAVTTYRPTGAVTLTTTPSGPTCQGTLGLSGLGHCKLTFTSAGVYTVNASYPGDANHTASNNSGQNPPITVTVNP